MHPAPDIADAPKSGANIYQIPLTRDERERAVARATLAPQGPVTVIEIARRLHINDMPQHRQIIDHIRLLHRSYGFPEPARPRFVNGVRLRGERSIVWKSTWARDLVEAWFSHDDNPANAALAKDAGRDRARTTLAANAQRLVAGGGV